MKNNLKTGLVIGKFLPMHNGHVFFINEALKLMDHVVVIVDENPISDKKIASRDGLKYPNLDERVKWMNSEFGGNPNVTIIPLSEEGIAEPPFGWKSWSELVKEKTKKLNVTHIFTSDISYKENYEIYFPNWVHIFFDNDRKATNGLSSTMVRKDLKGNISKLPKTVQDFYNND